MAAEGPSSRVYAPAVAYALATGTFVMATTQYMLVGLLPSIARSFSVSVADAGLLITVFAVGMVVGTPAVALLTLRLPRRLTLTITLVVFAAGHVVTAVSSSFEVVAAARFSTALASGGYWAIAAVVAAEAAAPGARSRAIAIVLAGGTVANLIGVPMGALAGHLASWRLSFWVMAGLAAVVGCVVLAFVPPDRPDRSTSLRGEASVLRSPRLHLVLVSGLFVMGGLQATYSYIAPLLLDHAHLPAAFLPLALAGYGLGAFAGTQVGGRLGDRRPYETSLAAAVASAAIISAICLLSRDATVLVVLTMLMGLAVMTAVPILVSQAVLIAGEAPTIASALATASINVGTALGSWLAGRALGSTLGDVGPASVGVAMTAVALVPLSILAIAAAKRREPAQQEVLAPPEPG